MPVVAIIGAVAAIGFAAYAGTALAIIAAVGATVSAVGAITNNKALMIGGGIIGAIGGIAGLAQSAGIIGADAFTFGSSAANAAGDVAPSAINQAAGGLSGIDAEIAQWSQYGADLSNVADQSASAIGSVALDAAPTSAGPTQIIDQTSGALQPVEASTSPALAAAGSPDVTPAAGAIDSGVTIPQGGGGAGGTLGTVGNPADPASTTIPMSSAPAAPGVPTTTDPSATTNSILNGGQTVTGAPAPGTTVTGAPSADIPPFSTINQNAGGVNPSIWDNIKSVIGTPGIGTIASGVIQAGASFIAGATNGLTPAQIAALNAQAAANQAAANLSRTQQANMAQPLPVASRTSPVTGTPQGLINSPQRIAVTGAA